MSVSSQALDSAGWPDLLDRLNAIRLGRDWSYRELSADIQRATGFVVSAQTLQPLLSVPRDERAKPYDRTIHKIREYLQHVDEPTAQPDESHRTSASEGNREPERAR